MRNKKSIDNSKNKQQQLKILLRFLLFLIIISNVCLLFFRRRIFTYNSKYSNEIINTLSKADIRIYNNVLDTLEENINNNKITVINVLFSDRQKLFSNLKKNKILLDSFGNRINIIDIFINSELESVRKNDENVFNSFLDKILNNDIENFLKSNGIINVVVNVDKIDFEDKNIITNNVGNILILDEKNNLKNVFSDNTDVLHIKQTIIDISKNRKFLKKKKTRNNEYFRTNNGKPFIGELKNFILIENDKDYDYPFFVILDSREKHIFLTTINGEIFKMIDLFSFCYPNNLKFYNGILYISDMCSGSIKYVDSLKYSDKIETLIQSKDLVNIVDFEFIDDNNIFVVKTNEDSQMIYNLQSGLSKKISYSNRIGNITNIAKYNNKMYFFDFNNNILYYYNNETEDIQPKLNFQFKENIRFNVSYFVINNERNIYFLNKDLNKVYVYSDEDIKEKNFNNFLNYPNDLKIFRNYFYFLSDSYLQRINFLTNESENIKLSFSKKFTFDVLKFIEDVDSNVKNSLIEEKISTVNNKINLVCNNIEFLSNSPSFLLLFKKEDNKMQLVNRFSLDMNNANRNIDLDYKFDMKYKYLLYGKVYYKDLEDNSDKVKTIYMPLKVDKKNNKDNNINIIL